MKTCEELYEMYISGDKDLYEGLMQADCTDLCHECDKNIAKYYNIIADYYDFKNWLENNWYNVNKEA